MIKMKVIGMGAAITKFRNFAEKVPSTARSQMRRSAERVVTEAKINVPRDSMLLENSIRIEKTYGYHGRLQIDIVAGGQDGIDPNGRLISLDQYAALVHENYEGAVANVNGPGPETLKKMAAHPGRVGSKFLERAAETEEPKLTKNIISIITDIEGSSG